MNGSLTVLLYNQVCGLCVAQRRANRRQQMGAYREMKAGEKYGAWTLVGEKPLGEGGNSAVWRAEGVNGEQAAIKFLTRIDRYAGFRSEVQFQRDLSTHQEVLPLLDSYLPDAPSKANRPWLVTPLATPIRDHIEKSGNKLVASVNAIHQIALTLVEIHARNAAHRDIKPENLFIYSNRAVLGDFGLVTYPGKEPITESGERLGPIHYVGPELIGNTDESRDCRPGDVYALAKTLWVLATGQRYPLPGNLSAHELACQISAYVPHERAVLLERFLDSATVLNPEHRPTASDFVTELSAWLSASADTSSVPAIADAVWTRLRQLTEMAGRVQRERDVAREECAKLMTELHIKLKRMGEDLATNARIASRSKNLPDGNTNLVLQHFPCYDANQKETGADNRCFEEHFKTVQGTVIVSYWRSCPKNFSRLRLACSREGL
jgi:serine/threonine protein kinase